MGSEETSGLARPSGNRTSMEAPEEQSRIQILPRFHVQNEAVRVLKMGVAQQGYVGCIGPIAPGLGGGTSRSKCGHVNFAQIHL